MSDQPTEDDDMPDEIDFSGGVRGLHHIPPGAGVLQERWDAELDRDASAGKLDFLIAEAQEDREHGRLMDWPPAE